MATSGPLLALCSAILFGLSPVLIKATIGEMSPGLTSGLLYLGSGIALLLSLVIQRKPIWGELRHLSQKQCFKFGGAIVSGGILAPLCLIYGIAHSSAFEVALLLNFETVATTLLAAFIFHEHVGGRVWFGKALIVLGAIFISVTSQGGSFSFSIPALTVLLACALWGLDNNLTREVEDLPPAVLAGVKGLIAGLFNFALALTLGESLANPARLTFTLIIGALCYGVSLVLFVKSLRLIGSSRTSTYFACGPFIGMLCAVAFLSERPAPLQWIAGLITLGGIWSLYREHHSHEHDHEATEHSHRHVYDEHHRHEHIGGEGPEPHEHAHHHSTLRHSHPHLPDIHHRHRHK